MAMKVLEIVGGGRAGLAAHTRALRRAGADVHLLLRGSAVLYAVRGDGAAAPQSANDVLAQADLPDREVASLVQKGSNVYYVEDDARARCIVADQLVAGCTPVRRNELPALLNGYERIWRW
jgi:predicted NAD/FAD-dependent oxidoreductase